MSLYPKTASLITYPICHVMWTKDYSRPYGGFKHLKTENLNKSYEDKVSKNEAFEKDSTLIIAQVQFVEKNLTQTQ